MPPTFSNEGYRYTRIIEIPALAWALTDSVAEQMRLEWQRSGRDADALDRRPPDERFVRVDRAPPAPNVDQGDCVAEQHPKRPRNQRSLQWFNEHDGLHQGMNSLLELGALVFVLGFVTGGCTPASYYATEGLASRLCSLHFLQHHFLARLSHVVLEVTTQHAVALASSAFLRGCAPLGAQLIDRGVRDYRIDGFLDGLHDTDRNGPFRIAHVNVGGVCYARWPQKVECVGDLLLVALVADVYDPESPAVAGAPALRRWLDRGASDITYDVDEYDAYIAAREMLLLPEAPVETPAETPVETPAGRTLRATNLRLIPTTSTFLWASGSKDPETKHRELRIKLGLRASALADGAAQEVVIGLFEAARVMELDVSWDQLHKVRVCGGEFVEAEAGAVYEMYGRS